MRLDHMCFRKCRINEIYLIKTSKLKRTSKYFMHFLLSPIFYRQFKQKIETNDSDTEDTFSFDLWNIYHFNTELSAPLTGDEIVILPNVVLVVSERRANVRFSVVSNQKIELK